MSKTAWCGYLANIVYSVQYLTQISVKKNSPTQPPTPGNMLDSALVPESTVLEEHFDINMSETDSVNVFNSYNKM